MRVWSRKKLKAILAITLLFAVFPGQLLTQNLTTEQIRANLLDNPPNAGDAMVREQMILALDSMLKHDSSRTAQSVIDFYGYMMEKVDGEFQDTVVAGARMWTMYNHGYVIRTPQVVFAFDLVDGYPGWAYHLSPGLLSLIDVLFISHAHWDHDDASVVDAVKANGGRVVYPGELLSHRGNTPMNAGDSLMLSGLRIRAHGGLHGGAALRIYEVTTPTGLKFLHTGDNQTSTALPEVDSPDVLLLNAWVNESGSSSAVAGMRNCIAKLHPELVIPGHIQELNHDYVPGDPITRVPYEWAFEVDDEPIAAILQVMTWGEQFSIAGIPVRTGAQREKRLAYESFHLQQNYPNPFNPMTTVRYEVSERAEVKLIVYDILGREIVRLVDSQQESGGHQATWNCGNIPSGLYFVRMVAPGYSKSVKMVLMR